MLSLEVAKAFNIVEWQSLWAVLSKFGFGLVFTSWAKLLYKYLMAAIREAGRFSPPLHLGRDTHRGCLLSPLFFALAIEPLATSIQQSPGIVRYDYGELNEKIMHYVDDLTTYSCA